MHDQTDNNGETHKRIRTLIADDSVTFRNALKQFLICLPHIEVVGAAENGEHALKLMPGTRPELVLMDVQMPRLNGLDATQRIRVEFPVVRVIMITLHYSDMWRNASAAAGADRFIPKHRLHDELPRALAQLFPGRASAEEAHHDNRHA